MGRSPSRFLMNGQRDRSVSILRGFRTGRDTAEHHKMLEHHLGRSRKSECTFRQDLEGMIDLGHKQIIP